MGRFSVGRKVPGSKQFRIIALLNTIYLYKGLMYASVFTWAIFGTVSGLHHKAWDYSHLGKGFYCVLHFSLIAAPVISAIALKTKHQIISLYFSFTADSSIAFALLAYSMMILNEYGLVVGCPILWGMCTGLLAYAISDIALIRLINNQPNIATDEHLFSVRSEIDRARLKEYVGLHKWQALTEAAGGAEILEKIIQQKNSK